MSTRRDSIKEELEAGAGLAVATRNGQVRHAVLPFRPRDALVSDSPAILSGDFAGRYTIERELGRGGTSMVYLAHEADGRAVAIKVMRTELISAINTERFLREVRVTSRLEHPNIVAVLDSGQYKGEPYFVLPYMTGGTLRDRIAREKQLSINEVVTLGAKISRALQFAHERNFLHRDVKPENILFSDGECYLADFGIARALTRSTDESTTSTGIVRGTPAYMSPEQAAGERDTDARSDIYSLACVLYEALAGIAAFVGPTHASVVAQRLTRVPPGVRVYRATVPEGLEHVLERALAISPADRFQTAEEFATALENAHEFQPPSPTTAPDRSTWRRRQTSILVSLAAIVLAVGAWWYDSRSGWLETIGLREAKLDTSVVAVIASDATTPAGAVRAVRSRLTRWRGLTLVDDSVVSAALRSLKGSQPGDRDRNVARVARAGRFVRVASGRVGDSIEVSAALYDTRSNARLVEKTVRAGVGSLPSAAIAEALADTLLFRGDVQRVSRPQGPGGTTSLAAWRAFLRGQSALEEGDLVKADSAFFAASRIDPDDAQSLIWLANVRSWMTNWNEHAWGQLTKQASQAVARRGPVAAGDSVLLSALIALDAKDYKNACPAWSRLTMTSAFDYAAWYGLANCLRRDKGVLPDSRSPTGWSFRTSYEQVVRGFEQAFRLRPSMLRGFGGRSLADLQDLFFTAGAWVREGIAVAPDTGEFQAVPIWQNDSLAFIAMRKTELARSGWPDAVALAVQRERERFHTIAQMWRVEAGRNLDAVEALAVSLEMLGDASAIDTMRYARTLARDEAERVRVASSEVLLRIKFSLPADTIGLKTARALADTLLREHPPSQNIDSQLLGSLAGLTGRASLAAEFSTAGGAKAGVPSAVAQSGPALLAFAALGGPGDSLASLEGIVAGTAASVPADARQIRAGWIVRSALLAFPDYKMRALSEATQSGPSADAQTTLAAALTGSPEVLRRRISSMARARANVRPADVKMEGLFLGASALASIGDTQAAIGWLDPTLRTLRLSASRNLANVVATGPLVRAMVLRARLADRVGDRATARTWARAVLILWSDADAFLQPSVQEVRRFTH